MPALGVRSFRQLLELQVVPSSFVCFFVGRHVIILFGVVHSGQSRFPVSLKG